MTREETRALNIETGVEDAAPELSDDELRQQLVTELDEMTERVKETTPDYEPPPFSPQRLVALIEELLSRFPQAPQLAVLERLRGIVSEDMFDIEVWKGAWYMLNYTVQYNVDMVKRRFTGEYDTDEWGLDWEFLDAVRPFFTFLYKFYWRIETNGLDNIPIEGRALLVANHSGQIPWDGTMLGKRRTVNSRFEARWRKPEQNVSISTKSLTVPLRLLPRSECASVKNVELVGRAPYTAVLLLSTALPTPACSQAARILAVPITFRSKAASLGCAVSTKAR